MKGFSSFLIGGAFFFFCLDVVHILKTFSLPSGLADDRTHPMNGRLPRSLGQSSVFGIQALSCLTASAVSRLHLWFKRLLPQDRSGVLWDEIAFSIAFHIKAGATVTRAIQEVSREGATEGHKALGRIFEIYQAGSGLRTAINAVSKDFPALERIGGILDLGLTMGGNLPSLLCHASEMMRRKRLFQGEVRAKLSEAKMTATLLSILPWLMAFLMMRLDSSLLGELAENHFGRTLVFLSLLLWVMGIALIVTVIGSISPKGGAD